MIALEQASAAQKRTDAAPGCTRMFAFAELSRDGRCYASATEVLQECSALLRLNGADLCRLACTPTDLRELAAGRLLIEGFVEGGSDLLSIEIAQGVFGPVVEARARRAIVPRLGRAPLWVPTAGSPVPSWQGTGPEAPFAPLPEHLWCIQDVFSLCDEFAHDTPLHHRTSGTHSCRVAVDGRLAYTSEDIGRHNAMDKAVGYLGLRGIDPARVVLFTSGRVPTDMACKAIRAKVPVLVSKAAPTDEAVRLAQRFGLTLVCKAEQEKLRVFSGAELAY